MKEQVDAQQVAVTQGIVDPPKSCVLLLKPEIVSINKFNYGNELPLVAALALSRSSLHRHRRLRLQRRHLVRLVPLRHHRAHHLLRGRCWSLATAWRRPRGFFLSTRYTPRISSRGTTSVLVARWVISTKKLIKKQFGIYI